MPADHGVGDRCLADWGGSRLNIAHTLLELLHMFMRRLWRDCSAATLIEYCFAVGIITSLIVIAVGVAGGWIHDMWVQLLVKLSG